MSGRRRRSQRPCVRTGKRWGKAAPNPCCRRTMDAVWGIRCARSTAGSSLGTVSEDAPVLPGSDGEHRMQEQWDSVDRAGGFYERQVLDHLNEKMREFLARQQMMFVSTADARGECDCSFRAGEPGFVTPLDSRPTGHPELRG